MSYDTAAAATAQCNFIKHLAIYIHKTQTLSFNLKC